MNPPAAQPARIVLKSTPSLPTPQEQAEKALRDLRQTTAYINTRQAVTIIGWLIVVAGALLMFSPLVDAARSVPIVWWPMFAGFSIALSGWLFMALVTVLLDIADATLRK